ncbi:MAG TPA: glycogen/starch/alpha-glucan phosphorylase [Stellaceae bacterium]|nr:glycogen/starch/alpha-glucan phosphorylase [Stellaceae bacterium]
MSISAVDPKEPTPVAAEDGESQERGRRGTDALSRHLADRLLYSVGRDSVAASKRDWLAAICYTVRDRLMDRWTVMHRKQFDQDVKRVYYMSMEFLIGRALSNSLLATGNYPAYKDGLSELDLVLGDLAALEEDAALGNGGLGRLAACFLDSMATLGLPGYGYGIRYEYGMFAQRIVDGRQTEHPDTWLQAGNPWEFQRPEIVFTVKFGGRVEHIGNRALWVETDDVTAMAYDTFIPGFHTRAVNTLRLWSAKATREVEMSLFNQGDYTRAVEAKNRSENVSRVLYPDDSSRAGQELRLRQEYFFCSASLQDILARYLRSHDDLDVLPEKVAIHLNDTHPAVAVLELMRLMVDVHGQSFATAWEMCTKIFSYTNHTLMPEALETWALGLFGSTLPRHLELVLQINEHFLAEVREKFPEDTDLPRRVSLIDESGERRVRMAYLSVVASHKVNGVSKLHSNLMRETIFADFHRLYPNRFVNKTNGVTPRRWLNQANPGLAKLIDSRIGEEWRLDLMQLERLKPLVDDAGFRAEFRQVKAANKAVLANHILRETGVRVDPDSLFDVQIKRLHEYKRQLLNLLHVVTRYQRILADPSGDFVPRTVVFAGKAASGYHMAKLIIHLINSVAARVNSDERIGDRLKVVFLPNYNVSLAEIIIPAADLSEQISTAGTEASGTGNMKLALNGALTIGTEDGANIEIRDQVGDENIFIFGHTTSEVQALRAGGYDPHRIYDENVELRRVLNQIGSGYFSADEPGRFQPIIDALLRHGDHYLLLADFAAYVDAQDRVDRRFRQTEKWTKRAILNVAGMGPFSSDRAIKEYADEIWHVEPVKL